jgi:short-subunit dehydrogenase
MTKFAMEAYADALADEMKSFGVDVSLIEPGAYRSNIGKSALLRMDERNQSADDSDLKTAMDESVN